MSLGRFVSEQWPYLLGAAGVAGVVGVAIMTRPRVGPAGSFVPPSTTRALTWVALDGSPIRLVRGRRYRGCVQVPFVVPTSMVVSRLPQGLADRGFTDVRISRPRPSDWPSVACDVYVECTWGRADESLERPGSVSLAWQGVEAPV